MPSSTSRSPERTPTPGNRFTLPGRRPRRIAHRGLALHSTENTLSAFAQALEAGATMLETDTRATSDGLALAVHDETLERIAQDPRRIDALTASEAGAVRLRGEEPLAMLEDVLGTFVDVPVNIDVKSPDAIVPAVTAIARTRSAERVCVTSFDGLIARSAANAVKTATGVMPLRSPSRGAMASFLATRALELPQKMISRVLRPYAALQVPRSYRGLPVVTPASVAAAHRAGCEVHVWTVDEPLVMQDLLAQRVDGIITGRVDLLSALLDGPAPAGGPGDGIRE